MFKEIIAWKVPIIEQTSVQKNRLFRRMSAPFIEKYNSELHTKELINQTWEGVWSVLGEIVDFKYDVPKCKRTNEEIAKLEEKNRAVLLLPDYIFTVEGLVRLSSVFPFRITWNWDEKEYEKIFHNSKKGGCIDVEMQLTSAYMIAGGHNEPDLRKEIESDGKFGQRLSTYIIGSEFSKLITGYHFDENGTCSRLLESYYCDGKKKKTLSATYNNSSECIEILVCGKKHRETNLGARSEGRKVS